MGVSPTANVMHGHVLHAQSAICDALQSIDPTPIHSDTWSRPGGGGGLTRILSDGAVFEKAGVNVSAVYGSVTTESQEMFRRLLKSRGCEVDSIEGVEFFATGVSLVIHPVSPFIPTVHANYRYFECNVPGNDAIWWFGGGADLTPYYLFEEDVRHFHEQHKDICDQYDTSFYPQFKKQCDDYFYLPHRKETRGVGGIFYDYLHDRDQALLCDFSSAAAHRFIDAYLPIVRRRMSMDYTDRHKAWQEVRRGRYAEFNLVYDRGTAFGLKTDGRVESILMSMPPRARWIYGDFPNMTDQEATLLDVLSSPRDWID